MKHTDRKCVICGAFVPCSHFGFQFEDTCSALCNRAKQHGRTREEQVWHDPDVYALSPGTLKDLDELYESYAQA